MSKAPAFQFYVRDWILSRSIQKMNGEEVKAYVYLLAESWLETPRATLPNDDNDLSLMAKLPMEKWMRVKPRVMANFILTDNRWINEKLAGVSETQKKFKEWGKKGGNPNLEPKQVNPDLNPPLKPLVNLATATATASSSLTSNMSRFVEPTAQEVEEYAAKIDFQVDGEYFVSHYRKTGWKIKGSQIKDWKACVVTWKKGQTKNKRKDPCI